jgi:hypothetical protein
MHRAEKPRIPPPTRAFQRAAEKRSKFLLAREGIEHRSMVRGLLILAVIVLLASMVRAGFGNVFTPGWWHP